MGALGRWITSLTDEERDRIVEAQDWARCGADEDEPDGPKCVMKHANWDRYWNDTRWAERSWRTVTGKDRMAFEQFEKLVDRFGLPRIVRAVKARAGYRSPVPEMSDEGERSGPGAWPVTVNPGRGA